MTVFGSTRAITGTDTPVQGTDDGAFLTVTGNCVVTLNATGWVAGRSAVAFEVTGAASLTFTEGAGVTIRAANSDETVDVQYQSCVATYTAANTWTVHKGVDPADFLAAANNLSDVASAATARTNLGVAIGSDVQAHSAVLDATTASFTTADETKLDGIADGSDVGDMLASTYDAAGHASQVLTEADTQTVTNKTINDFSNSVDADAVHEQVRNESGGTLTAGTPVYASGYSVGQELVLVDAADATSASTMPVLGLVEADISNNATGAIVESGLVKNIDTSSWSVGDVLFVSETAGTLTTTKPTGTALVEEVAEVLRSHATLGIVEVIIAPAVRVQRRRPLVSILPVRTTHRLRQRQPPARSSSPPSQRLTPEPIRLVRSPLPVWRGRRCRPRSTASRPRRM
jgi:hypothetical protein